MKKIRLLFVLTFSLVLLSACGKGSSNLAKDTSENSNSNEPIELTFLHIHGGATGELINELCKEFEESKGGKVKVTPIYTEGSYEGVIEKLQTMALSKNLPNVSQAGHQYAYFMNDNLPIVPAEEFIKENSVVTDDFFPKMLDLGKNIDGKQIGMPFAVSTSILYLNRDMFKENGLDPDNPPKTFDEMREVAKKLTKDGKYGIYIDYQITGNWEIQTMVEDLGGQMLTEDRKVFGAEREMEYILTYLNDLVNVDKSMPLMNNEQGTEAFKAGKVGMYITTTAGLRGFQADSNFDISCALHPTNGGESKGAPAGGNSLYVLKSTPEAEKLSWELVEFLTSPEATTRVAQTAGYMVTRQSAYEAEELMGQYLKENPAAAVTYEQVDWMSPWTNFPGNGGTKYVKVVQDGIESVLNNQKTTKEANEKIIKDLNAIIKGQ